MQQSDGTGDGSAISLPTYSVDSWKPAMVPGTLLNSLVLNAVYPEPYFGLNNQRGQNLIPDLATAGVPFYTYWFRTAFTVPSAYSGQRVWLQFDGINYMADVWINGQKVGSLAGMFQRGVFDVTAFVTAGSSNNTLAVLVHPTDPPNGFSTPTNTDPGATNENNNGADGNIGKFTTMLMTAGWDFTFKDGIRDRNTGIWRDIKLFATGPVTLRSPFVASTLPLPATSPSSENISVEVTNATAQPQTGTLTATIAEGSISVQQAVTLQPNATQIVTFSPTNFPALTIQNPQLWWPFNKGAQPLYHLTATFTQNGVTSDQITSRFGIRDIRSDQNTPNSSRIFYVNGKRLFLHGANWIPEAMCRTSDDRTDAELRYTRQAGVNFLRLWAGGVAESDEFFDKCDELGILVWVEFWLTGNTVLPTDSALYRSNVTDTVKRLRDHPSLAYYVSANERTSIITIQDLLTQYDGTRGYQVGSEVSGVHDGSPYVCVNPMWYYDDTASDRGSRMYGLCPEYGAPILPTVDALREMMSESDLWPINKTTWDYLDGDGFHGMSSTYVDATNQYGTSSSIDEFTSKAQMFGGLAYRSIWECWNAQRFEYGDRFSTGLLFWYLNSANRQTCGRMWDWSLEPTAGLYFSQKAHEPLHAQYDFVKNTVGVNNEYPIAYSGMTLTTRILNFDMTEVYRQTSTVNAPTDAFVKNAQTITLPANLSPIHFIKLTLTDSSGNLVSDNFYWRSTAAYTTGRTYTGPEYQGFSGFQSLPKVDLSSTVTQHSDGVKNYYQATVTNPSSNLAFMVWLRLQDGETNKPIRPAFYDDNFFSLLPGESRTINIDYSIAISPSTTKLVVDGWNVTRTQYRQGAVTPLPDIRAYGSLTSTNLALNQPVTVSSTKTYAAANAVDGNVSTRWSSSYADGQWIYVDLGSPKAIGSVDLTWEVAYASQYHIDTSLDATNWTPVVTNNAGAGGTEHLVFSAVKARYVRMYGVKRATQYGFSLWEFAVYAPTNLALARPVTASTVQTGYPAVNAVDSDLTTRWSSLYQDNQSLAVDLGATRDISAVKLLWQAAYAATYKIQVSSDGQSWTDAASVLNGAGGEEFVTFPHAATRYVRMLGLTRATQYGFSLFDFAVYPYVANPGPVSAPPSTNTAPVVSASAAGTPYVDVPFPLSGYATDDGKPSGALNLKWVTVSGPAPAALANVYDPNTSVTFTKTGAYTMQLQATDGALTSAANVNLTVQSLYDNWAAGYFNGAQLQDLSTSGQTADPNFDGVSNLVCYATGVSPWVSGATGLPKVSFQSGHLQMVFQRDTSALDIAYFVDASSDLTTWQVIASGSQGSAISGSAATVQEAGVGRYHTVTVIDNQSNSVSPRRFLRFRVVRP